MTMFELVFVFYQKYYKSYSFFLGRWGRRLVVFAKSARQWEGGGGGRVLAKLILKGAQLKRCWFFSEDG